MKFFQKKTIPISTGERAGKPRDGAVVEKKENGEYHVYPKTGQHVAEPTCFCGPFLDPSDECLWVHRKEIR